MFLTLCLEYIEAFNDRDTTPNIPTALERVVMAQSQLVNDEVFSEFKDNLQQGINQENLELPLTEK
jgi:hypothetical protein